MLRVGDGPGLHLWSGGPGGSAEPVEGLVQHDCPGPVPVEVQPPGTGGAGQPGRDVDDLAAEASGFCVGQITGETSAWVQLIRSAAVRR